MATKPRCVWISTPGSKDRLFGQFNWARSMDQYTGSLNGFRGFLNPSRSDNTEFPVQLHPYLQPNRAE